MGLRPISGWVYAGTGDVSPWTSLDGRFGASIESSVKLADALHDARARWGLSRVASVTAGKAWASNLPPSVGVGFCYAKLGPDADTGTLRSAWELLERGAADAVWVRAREAEFLVERTGDAPVALHCGARSPSPLTVDVDPHSMVTAVVVAAAIVELGLRCGPDGEEPERLAVQAQPDVWQLEVRT